MYAPQRDQIVGAVRSERDRPLKGATGARKIVLPEKRDTIGEESGGVRRIIVA